MNFEQTLNTSYTGMTQEEWNNLVPEINADPNAILTDEEIAELDKMI